MIWEQAGRKETSNYSPSTDKDGDWRLDSYSFTISFVTKFRKRLTY